MDVLDIVLLLTKDQLIGEVIRLDTRTKVQEKELNGERERYEKLFEAYQSLVEKSEARFDNLIDSLKPKEAPSQPVDHGKKPLRATREPWTRARARVEARDKEQYWEAVKKQREEAERLNPSMNAAAKEAIEKLEEEVGLN